LEWLAHILIVLIVLGALIAICKIWLFPLLGALDGRIVQTVNILIFVIVACIVIWMVVEVLSCALGGGLGMSHLGHS
jgi:predicted membrane channel-forming protein YqfA (hemolysin III family)